MTSRSSDKFKTQKTAFYVLITYIICQLSVLLLIFIPGLKDSLLQLFSGMSEQDQLIKLSAWWSTISFAVAFIVSFILISRNKQFWDVFKGEKASIGASIGWGIIGFFLVFLGQTIGAYIELALGIDMGSENTEAIMSVTKVAPIMIIATVLLGPILEELVFRRVIFGSIIQNYNFWIASIISAIVFAAIHMDFTHILLYTICGMIFAFLYHKTKRLLTPIIAHILLNGFVTFIQMNADKFQI
ncbi:type II CAAX endopeptidase family protein [Solibacillus sp. FSL W7-1472]|uniref:Predicted metal-dependent membrane protease n=2 Tax=Solibacillus TaxID=648800 RepID=F2F6G6_SOLSS|nr:MULTISPECIES: type II CAAX endopeptidase family protein [Solibacillus]AMO87109.1 CAAX protease [Solibacillus silvestris]EKB43623.1 exosortase E/protease, VPEID-CTERM system [Solibacillus isronensis B3W22]OBW59114.1 CAAX protease [Solibacillus silvestris]BAK14860.1 predicted metal-dependent membrane protease [Solibacillus silvestris StLB046]